MFARAGSGDWRVWGLAGHSLCGAKGPTLPPGAPCLACWACFRNRQLSSRGSPVTHHALSRKATPSVLCF